MKEIHPVPPQNPVIPLLPTAERRSHIWHSHSELHQCQQQQLLVSRDARHNYPLVPHTKRAKGPGPSTPLQLGQDNSSPDARPGLTNSGSSLSGSAPSGEEKSGKAATSLRLGVRTQVLWDAIILDPKASLTLSQKNKFLPLYYFIGVISCLPLSKHCHNWKPYGEPLPLTDGAPSIHGPPSDLSETVICHRLWPQHWGACICMFFGKSALCVLEHTAQWAHVGVLG